MAKCEFCDKGVTFGIRVSHSHRRSNRPWKPNVKRVKAIVNGTPRHVYVCTRCLRSGKVTRAIYATKQIRSTAKAVLLFLYIKKPPDGRLFLISGTIAPANPSSCTFWFL